MEVIPYGDQGLLVRFDKAGELEANQLVKSLYQRLKSTDWEGIKAIIPSHRDLLIYFDPNLVDHNQLIIYLKKEKSIAPETSSLNRCLNVPMLYGGAFGPDLIEVAAFHKLSTEDFIALHTQQVFQVYSMGFLPGFAYLGHFPTPSPTPRKANPRTQVEAGSVAIAGHQTGIYPSSSSGGWQIIGRTPIPLLLKNAKSPFLISPDNTISFYQISESEFERWISMVNSGSFRKEDLYE
ncbi:MAG: 5-oxoprolinase subunit PxpB [Bacteroidia bacterium]|nr:5-oxoprolinase subunit PxpB [Bacteroidia bacterium]